MIISLRKTYTESNRRVYRKSFLIRHYVPIFILEEWNHKVKKHRGFQRRATLVINLIVEAIHSDILLKTYTEKSRQAHAISTLWRKHSTREELFYKTYGENIYGHLKYYEKTGNGLFDDEPYTKLSFGGVHKYTVCLEKRAHSHFWKVNKLVF